MASSRFQAALVSGMQETTLALASINFDFSLYKVEAPKEYRGLGDVLSRRRREAAEAGSEHVFARRLGALFAQSLPSTPKLVNAYGTRCSQIADSPTSRERGPREDGVFQDWIGVDGTSIWAAATSGQGAMAVHLLACMLARLWSASEATSIWDELIQRRKEEVSNFDSSEPLNIPAVAAASVEITREQMSSWDASARAWLSVADAAKKREQTQLMLLVKDLGLSIDSKGDLFSSVMQAWKTAMVTTEQLLSGMPQSVTDGAALLGLASWHLYPNIYALGANAKVVGFDDNIVPSSSVVTLGAVSSSPDTGIGVRWSLPLAYLRYYGEPVRAQRTVGEGTTRISMDDCFQVILGVVFAGWREYGDDFNKACEIITAIARVACDPQDDRPRDSVSWLAKLAAAAEKYMMSTDLEAEHMRSLIARGRRRHEGFLGVGHPPPMFGLDSVEAILSVISRPENRLTFLRKVAETIKAETRDLEPHDLIIRYRWTARSLTDTNQMRISPFGLNSLISVFPSDEDSSSASPPSQFYQPMVVIPNPEDQATNRIFATALRQGHNPRKRKFEHQNDMTGHFRWMKNPKVPCTQEGEQLVEMNFHESPRSWSNGASWGFDLDRYSLSTPSWPAGSYEYLLGDNIEAAIFKQSGSIVSMPAKLDPHLLISALQDKLIDPYLLVGHLGNSRARTHASRSIPFMNALRAFAAAANVYKVMPAATVHPAIFSVPILEGKWVPEEPDISFDKQPALLICYELTRAQAFSCVARFENININVDPRDLTEVMAISAANSIYVSMPLLCDPFERPMGFEMWHILGNIGKPGLNFMIPPPEPKVAKLDEDRWAHINHAPFRGDIDDCFQHTSLHLSFTRYNSPVGATSHSEQTAEAFFVETIVSVFDRATWVADLDIIGSLEKSCLMRMERPATCPHKGVVLPRFLLSCIDSWDEYIDRPKDPAIFRCHNNWVARLSAAAISAKTGRKTILFKDKDSICWECFRRFAGNFQHRISLSPHNKGGEIPIFIC